MIVSLRTLTYDELKGKLDKDDKIIIWTCNLCIKLCGTGGEEVGNDLAEKLKADGFNIITMEQIGYACHMVLIRNRLKEPYTKPMFQKADTVIVLTCTDGFEKAERLFSRGKFKMKKIIEASATVGIGVYNAKDGMRVCNPIPEFGLKADVKGIPLTKMASASKGKMHAGKFE